MPRLRRRTFWLATLALWLLFFIVREGLGLERTQAVASGWAALMLLGLAALAIARLRDRNHRALALAAVLIPVAGALWLFWELALRRGTAGDNNFGPDPRTRNDSR